MSCGIFVQKKDDEPFSYTYGVSVASIDLPSQTVVYLRCSCILLVPPNAVSRIEGQPILHCFNLILVYVPY